MAPADGSAQVPVGLLLGGLGIIGITVGAITGAMVLGKKSVVDDPANCQDGLCNDTGVQAADEGRTLSTVSTVTFLVGAAALAGGVVLIATAEGDPAVEVAIGPTADGGVLQLAGRF